MGCCVSKDQECVLSLPQPSSSSEKSYQHQNHRLSPIDTKSIEVNQYTDENQKLNEENQNFEPSNEKSEKSSETMTSILTPTSQFLKTVGSKTYTKLPKDQSEAIDSDSTSNEKSEELSEKHKMSTISESLSDPLEEWDISNISSNFIDDNIDKTDIFNDPLPSNMDLKMTTIWSNDSPQTMSSIWSSEKLSQLTDRTGSHKDSQRFSSALAYPSLSSGESSSKSLSPKSFSSSWVVIANEETY